MNEVWTQDKEQLLAALHTNLQTGLSQNESNQRLKQFGLNRLAKERKITFWNVFREEVTEPMILLLLVVGVVYSFWGELRDAITIFVIITILVLTEIATEYRAKKAVAALRKLTPTTCSTVRDGLCHELSTLEIVTGDIILLEVGMKVPADARLIEVYGLEVDESLLTGESVPTIKDTMTLPPDTPLAERINMVYAGSTITRGRGKAVVTATGMATELGKTTGLVLEAKEPKTPLQLAMKQLAGLLVWVAVFFSVVIPGIGFLQGKPWQDMILTGLSLSFATIPEELPIVITMVLGVGALALSKRNVLIRRLRAAETLGGVTTIITDKTGTLTENKMTLSKLVTANSVKSFSSQNLSSSDLFLLKIGFLTSNIKKGTAGNYIGDPLEIAIVEAIDRTDIAQQQLRAEYQLQKEFSFDNQRKIMSAIYRTKQGSLILVKGAPEIVLAKSSHILQGTAEMAKTGDSEKIIQEQVENLAGEAMRIIAFAYKKVADPAGLSQEDAEGNLVLVGLVGFIDPPRAGVKEALETLTTAGIRTMVVSGDHPLTVAKIAARVGIQNEQQVITGSQLEKMTDNEFKNIIANHSLFARTTAEQKLKIVTLLRSRNEVVAVTGDGINDAPALKSADIGIAMGETGTEVAREAANMILTDDSFISIAAGVREGRKIFDNLKKGISYYLSVKVALVLCFLIPLILSISFPFSPIQIIILELFMDLAASATFVAEPIELDVMKRPPRNPLERFINRKMLLQIALGSISLAAAVIFNYLLVWYLNQNLLQAQTIAFATWLIGHIFLAVNMRSERLPLSKLGFFSNKTMLVWGGCILAMLIIITSVPQAQTVLRITSLDLMNWLLAIVIPLVTLFWMELYKVIKFRK